MRALLLMAALLVIATGAEAKQHRSHAATATFKREHPCPSTQATQGKCRGWIIDHITPLCAGGADLPSNMQWQSISDAKAKDRDERRICRRQS